MLKNILKNSAWMAGDQILRLVSALFIGVLIARHLGPADFGALNFAISFCSIFGIFAALGLNRALVRDLANAGAAGSPEADRAMMRIVTSVLVLRLMTSVLIAALASAVSLVFGQGELHLVAILSATIVFSSFDVVDLFFQSQMRSRVTVLARSLAFFLFLGVKIALLALAAPVEAFAVATTAEAGCGAAFLWLAFRRGGWRPGRDSLDLGHALGMVRQSWPEIVAGGANVIFIRIDQVMIGNMIGPEAVGIYSVASRLAEAWYFVPTALVSSSFPAIVRLRETDRAAYLAALQKLLSALVILSYGVALTVTLFGPRVVEMLYGPAYAGSGHILTLLVWSGVFISMGIASGSYIMAERRPMLNMNRNICGAVANVALNLVLIPRYGATGAAVGTLLAQAVAFLLSDLFSAPMRPVGRMKLRALLLMGWGKGWR